MNHRKALLWVAVAAVILAPAYAADVSGKWTCTVETPVGTLHYTYDLKAEGMTLSGTAANERGTTTLTEGKIDGDAVSFVEPLDFEGQQIRIEYTGKIAGDELHLHRSVGDFGAQDIVAKRAQ